MSLIQENINLINSKLDTAYSTKGDIQLIERLELERDYLIQNCCDNCGLYWKDGSGLCKTCKEMNRGK